MPGAGITIRRFLQWINESNEFFDTLVDRIVSGYSEEERSALKKTTGFDDELIVVAEPYHLLVIKGPESMESVLPFCTAELNVIWTDDITPYRTLKVRLLNGNHTFMTMCGLGMGLGNVLDCMKNETVKNTNSRLNGSRCSPACHSRARSQSRYFSTVLDRLANPYLDHRLSNIALNSVSKWKSRLLPSLLDYYTKKAPCPRSLSFSLAALTYRYTTVTDVQDDASRSRSSDRLRQSEERPEIVRGGDHFEQHPLRRCPLTRVGGLCGLFSLRRSPTFSPWAWKRRSLKATEEARAKEGGV